jgi:methylated-DNA-[protein]-cysteine S-methyltransferase
MDHNAPAERTLTVDSSIGKLGISVTGAGLRRVRLPRVTSTGLSRQPGGPAAGASPAAGVPDGGQLPGCAADAIEQLTEYLNGSRNEFELPLDLSGIEPGMRTVLDELRVAAPYGKVITYGELAQRSGCAGGARAVGQIMARNPLPLVIGCHRVVAVGDLGGYGGGLALKRWLLRLEGALTEQLSLLGDEP